MTMGRRAVWVTMMVLASLVALYAGAVLLVPGFGPPFILARRAAMPLAVVFHLAGGSVALLIGAWQLNAGLRNRRIAVHRWMGRTYVAAVGAGGIGALFLAPFTQEGMVTHVGFGTLGVLWLVTTNRGWLAIRRQDEATHRRWMIRSYALTLAAVTLRIYLPASFALRIPFHDGYRVIAWLCWVPNLLLAEWWLRRRSRGTEAPAGTVAEAVR